MSTPLYEYTIIPTEGADFPTYFATRHKETGNFVSGKFILYNGNEIIVEVIRGHIKAWSREKVDT